MTAVRTGEPAHHGAFRTIVGVGSALADEAATAITELTDAHLIERRLPEHRPDRAIPRVGRLDPGRW